MKNILDSFLICAKKILEPLTKLKKVIKKYIVSKLFSKMYLYPSYIYLKLQKLFKLFIIKI